jgi:hypothetical protein
MGLLSSAEFTTLLFVAVLLQGFALILGRARGLSRRGGAEEKAGALLKEWLSPAQLEEYEKNGHFEVTGGHSRKHYRIRRTRQMNVDELDQYGVRSAAWCFGPEGELPIGDVMLAQKIALENDEMAALALANRQHSSVAAPIWLTVR